MIKEFIKLINAYAHGEPGEFEFTFTWLDLLLIVATAALIFYAIWKL